MHITDRPQRTYWFLLWLLTAIALLLRLYHLGYSQFWYDEIGQVLVAQNSWWETITASIEHEGKVKLSVSTSQLTETPFLEATGFQEGARPTTHFTKALVSIEHVKSLERTLASNQP